jgi:hypothetical protein
MKKRIIDPEAAALATSTDRLNAKLFEAEKVLRDLCLGVEGSVRLEQNREDNFLGFHKIDKGWSLVLICHGALEGPPLVSHVTSGSRDLRIKAAKKLVDLLEVLRLEVRSSRLHVDSANDAVDAFLNSVRS